MRRINTFLVILIVLSASVSFRLFFIQVVNGDLYTKSAVEQRTRRIYLTDYRGTIYDRNLIPLTDRKRSNYIIVFPDMVVDKLEAIKKISSISGLSQQKIRELMSGYSFKLPIKNDINTGTEEKGIYKVSIVNRYEPDMIASHIIGYLNNSTHKGIYGMEGAWDNVLNSGGSYNYFLYLDGNDDIIRGIGSNYGIVGIKRKPYGIKTTIDYHIQKIVEDSMDKHRINGAVVVLDVKSGQILAMASRPYFSPANVGTYLSIDGALVNKAIQEYPLGSVFKTVVAAAAFENKVVSINTHFYCDGKVKVGNVTYPCFNNKSHGNVDVAKAFAVSCNTTFIKIGQRVGANKIIEMTKKFGFGKKEGIGLLEEASGNLPSRSETVSAGIGNLSLGQGTLTVTPLQVADMMATIANNGIRNKPSIISGFVDEEENVVKKNIVYKSYRVISTQTAQLLKKLLRGVVVDGTGKMAEIQQKSAGKTGTAETGGTGGTDAWFAGFVPYDNPRYAIVVLSERGGEGGVISAPIFGEIAKEILKIK